MRELVELGELVVALVKTCDNLADFFTKPLASKQFFAMRDIIMNVRVQSGPVKRDVPSHIRGG